MTSHADIAERWGDVTLGREERYLGGATSNVFVRGDTLYSYGTHFPMAIPMARPDGSRWILQNGDRYSVTTSRHQSIVRGVVSRIGLETMIVPFSAIEGAGIIRESIEPIHVREDRMETRTHRSVDPPGERHVMMDDPEGRTQIKERWTYADGKGAFGPVEVPLQVPDPDRVYVGRSTWVIAEREGPSDWVWETRHHWLGDSLFSARVRGLRGRRKFLSSFDYQESVPLYFLCELPRRNDAWSVEQGYESLKPAAVSAAEDAGLTVTRQGDIFAIPTGLTTREVRGLTPWGKGRIVKRPYLLGTNHRATDVMFGTGDRVYARGCLYHDPGEWRDPDHARRKLGDGRTWHLLMRNTVPRSRG